MLRRHFINVSYSKDIKPNEIWYKTSNGEKFDYQLLIDAFVEQSDGQQLTLLKKNYLINDGWWCLTFTNNIACIGTNESEIWPIFIGVPDAVGQIETNILNITEIKLPGISLIGSSSFWGCTGLQSINIPNSVTSIGEYAFAGCTSLNSITFEGTIEQWNVITKGTGWNNNVPATVVHCTDGDVEL